MEILKFGDNPSPNRSNNKQGRKPGAMIVAGVLVAMMGMSTTLAGTITINTSGNVEFGQGVVTTAACDSSMDVTPRSAYSVSSNTFSVDQIRISGVDSACLGKWFTIRAYATTSGSYNGNDSATAMSLTASGNGATVGAYIKVKLPTSDTDTAGSFTKASASGTVADPTISGVSLFTGGSGAFNLGALGINSAITRITIESSDS